VAADGIVVADNHKKGDWNKAKNNWKNGDNWKYNNNKNWSKSNYKSSAGIGPTRICIAAIGTIATKRAIWVAPAKHPAPGLKPAPLLFSSRLEITRPAAPPSGGCA